MVRTRLDTRRTKTADLFKIDGIDTTGYQNVGAYEAKFLHRFARTMLIDEKPVAIFGVSPLWKGCAQAWSYIENEEIAGDFGATRYLLDLSKELISVSQELLALHRLQMSVQAAFEPAIRFAEHLGFSREARMARYGPDGEDHYLYAKVWE